MTLPLFDGDRSNPAIQYLFQPDAHSVRSHHEWCPFSRLLTYNRPSLISLSSQKYRTYSRHGQTQRASPPIGYPHLPTLPIMEIRKSSLLIAIHSTKWTLKSSTRFSNIGTSSLPTSNRANTWNLILGGYPCWPHWMSQYLFNVCAFF